PRAVAVPGHADDVFRVPAVDPAVRVHVPVRGHAAGGAVAGGGVAADAFPAADSRHHAARGGPDRDVAGSAGAAGVHGADDDAGDPAFPQAAGLTGYQAPGCWRSSPRRISSAWCSRAMPWSPRW